MFILDTDILTHLHAGHPKVVAALARLDDPAVSTTVITKIELLRGRYDFVLKAANGSKLLRAQQLLIRTEELLAQIPILPLDRDTAAQFEHLQQIRSLRKIGRADLLIASVTLAHRATLVTRNMRHFEQVRNLSVVNWMH